VQPHAYCTYFDSGYLSRGLALVASLRQHGDESPIWIMALDDPTHAYLMAAAIPGVHLLTIADLEAAVPSLADVRAGRSRMEGYFTATPLLVRCVLDRYPAPTAVAYLDADLYFFDDPQLVFDAMGDSSVGIIEHRYKPSLARRLAKYGRFNVGWVGFRNDEQGLTCLDWWGRSTLEWCRDTPDAGRYADQGYLDSFPRQFAGVAVLEPRGLNLAPWNTAVSVIEGEPGSVTVDGDPLVFFHFHGLKKVGRWWVTSQLVYRTLMGSVLRTAIYEPYVRELERTGEILSASPLIPHTAVANRGAGLRGLLFRVQRGAVNRLAVATGTAVRSARA
jgi:hypothetical protein